MLDLARRLLFLLDPETAHNVAISFMELGQNNPNILEAVKREYRLSVPDEPVEAFGLTFPNRIGLAAGFDKGARVLPMLQALGFGFVEVGTITPKPQPGNPRPRIFRLEKDAAIINRMGFNSEGADTVGKRVAASRSRVSIRIGISLGRNKTTPNHAAAYDYAEVASKLFVWGDYFVINVSSPNTPELRYLQTPEYLSHLVGDVLRYVRPKPVLVKFDPDSPLEKLRDMVSAAIDHGARGIILGNTTTNMPPSIREWHKQNDRGDQTGGGLSGRPVHEATVTRVDFIARHFPDLPIIGVGGIEDVASYRRMLDAGARLVQLYTGFIYKGPKLITQLREEHVCVGKGKGSRSAWLDPLPAA